MNKEILRLRRKILTWYQKNRRDLPWRRTRNPYHILVSEVMLQQTQVNRVIPKYIQFIKQFTVIDTLAAVPLSDVLIAWSGLGYNRRAKYLHQTARLVADSYKSEIPNTYEELRKLPGVGEYTANAVLCFAFGKKRPAVDTNVQNVIEAEFNQGRPLPLATIKKLVMEFLPDDNPAEALHALMDYSSIVLPRPKRKTARKSAPFRQSNRYLRGLLIKRLVARRSWRERQLIDNVEKDAHRPAVEIRRALQHLVSEGLVVTEAGWLALATSGSAAR